MEHPLKRIVNLQNRGIPKGICSVCSANRYVIEAAMEKALQKDSYLLVEVTANQVNQFGGYTGMKPADFKCFLYSIAAANGFPADMIILGGDHIGPLVWKGESPESAMEKACQLVRDLVLAGFTKIHIDTSMRLSCDDVNAGLSSKTIAERGAVVCSAAKKAFGEYRRSNPEAIMPVYVIGSEVPVPGGSLEHEDSVSVTKPGDFEDTLRTFQEAFLERGLRDCWENVIAVVVQPGVEFGEGFVLKYDPSGAQKLTQSLKQHKGIVFEGHSTDYQDRASLKAMVEDGIAILKVGPALTFALREALFALNLIEEEMFKSRQDVQLSRFKEVLETTMKENPEYWKNYYQGREEQIRLNRLYSYSDRSRYYLPDPEVERAVERLVSNLNLGEIPEMLLSQYMPAQYARVRRGKLSNAPLALLKDRIGDTLEDYYFAVTP